MSACQHCGGTVVRTTYWGEPGWTHETTDVSGTFQHVSCDPSRPFETEALGKPEVSA